MTIEVTDLNDNAPVFTSAVQCKLDENQTSAYSAAATDANAGTTLLYFLSGPDAALFDIDVPTGAVTFKVAPISKLPQMPVRTMSMMSW